MSNATACRYLGAIACGVLSAEMKRQFGMPYWLMVLQTTVFCVAWIGGYTQWGARNLD